METSEYILVLRIYRVSEKSGTNGNFIYYLLITLYALMFSLRHSTHFLSRFTMCVPILLNILGSTVAQQSVIQDVWH
jgi:hypothetical protein